MYEKSEGTFKYAKELIEKFKMSKGIKERKIIDLSIFPKENSKG